MHFILIGLIVFLLILISIVLFDQKTKSANLVAGIISIGISYSVFASMLPISLVGKLILGSIGMLNGFAIAFLTNKKEYAISSLLVFIGIGVYSILFFNYFYLNQESFLIGIVIVCILGLVESLVLNKI